MFFGNVLGARTLSAEVREWRFTLKVVPDEPNLTGRFLLLICQTTEAHFLPPTELDLELLETKQKPVYRKIVSKSQDGAEEMKMGEIVRYPEDVEHRIPNSVYGAVQLSPVQFKRIFDILNLAQSSQLLTATLGLSLYGLDLGFEICDDKWPQKQNLSIINMEFNLHPRPTKEERGRRTVGRSGEADRVN
jgi:hypothetical protein